MSLAKYVAGQMNSALGETVGYHVGGGREDSRRFSDKTKIKYCTDGLQLVKQLMDKEMTQSNGKETVLIIDEVHERNQNIEVLIAWVKLMKKKGKKIKLVLMSATIDAEQLQDFLEKDKSE